MGEHQAQEISPGVHARMTSGGTHGQSWKIGSREFVNHPGGLADWALHLDGQKEAAQADGELPVYMVPVNWMPAESGR